MPRKTPDLSEERYRGLWGAVYAADGPRVMDALAGEVPTAVLQVAGDGLLLALEQDVEGAAELAAAASAVLRERQGPGDEVLADQLDAALGSAPSPPLRPLPVDLDDLSSVLEGDPMFTGGRLDRQSGEVIPEPSMFESSLDDDGEDLEDPERWLYIDSEGSRPGYRDMVAFLDLIDDSAVAERMADRLQGRGAFRRFRDGLAEIGELERFYRFANDRACGRARAWLADHGYRPTTRNPR